MFRITLPADRAEPDMAAVASAFGISIKDVHDGIEIGTISRWFEVGDGDSSKPHQIFASAKLEIRVDVDEHGAVFSINKYKAARTVLPPDQAADCDTAYGKDTKGRPFDPNSQDNSDAVRWARLDALLDEALDESFPASDPIAISFDPPNRAARAVKKV
jgi:uncharacterized protein YuzE